MPKGVYVRGATHSSRTWTKAHLAILRENAGKLSGREIAPLVGHTKFAVLKKIELEGLTSFYPWPPARVEDLRANGSRMTVAEFAGKYGISNESARHMARKNGIKFVPRPHPNEWPAELVERLRELAVTHTVEEAAKELGRTAKSTRWKATVSAIKFHGQGGRKAVLRPCPWCAEEFGSRGLEKHTPRCTARPPRVKKVATPKPRPRRVSKPKPRNVVQVAVSRIAYCPSCRAPVSNQEQHYERMPQCKQQPTITQGGFPTWSKAPAHSSPAPTAG